MSRPVLMVVDDQAGDLETTERELRKRYAADYEIVCEPSPGGGVRYNLIVHTNGTRPPADEGAPLDERAVLDALGI